MAHPMNEFRSDKVVKNRVSKITHGMSSAKAEGPPVARRAAGGAVKGVAQRADGGAVKPRADKVSRAKGGRVKSGKTNINIIVAPGGQKPPMAGVGMPPMPPAPPPMPPKPPMAAAPPVPMGPSPGAGGIPMHADGGRAYKKGGAVKMKMSGEKKHGKKAKPFKMRADGGEASWEAGSGRSMLEDRKYAGMRHQTGNYTGPKRAAGGATTEEDRRRAGGVFSPTDTPEDYSRKVGRASGGAVDAAGIKGKTGIGDRTPIQHSGNKSDTQNIGRGPVITKATGGPVYSNGKAGKQMSWLKGVGAGGGEGRLKKAAHAK